MKTTVKLFAIAKQLADCDEITLELEPGETVAHLRRALASKIPALADVAPNLLFAIDNEYAGDGTVITEGAEIGCIPPVSGG